MTNVDHSLAIPAVVATLVLLGLGAAGWLPGPAVLTIAATVAAGLVAVAFAAQSRGFEAGGRRVYRPVYVRPRNVHRRVSSQDD